jgi:hypothetical protein
MRKPISEWTPFSVYVVWAVCITVMVLAAVKGTGMRQSAEEIRSRILSFDPTNPFVILEPLNTGDVWSFLRVKVLKVPEDVKPLVQRYGGSTAYISTADTVYDSTFSRAHIERKQKLWRDLREKANLDSAVGTAIVAIGVIVPVIFLAVFIWRWTIRSRTSVVYTWHGGRVSLLWIVSLLGAYVAVLSLTDSFSLRDSFSLTSLIVFCGPPAVVTWKWLGPAAAA